MESACGTISICEDSIFSTGSTRVQEVSFSFLFPLAIGRRVRYHSKAINGSGSMMRGARAESMVACDDLFIGEAFPAQARNFALITAMNRVYTPREIQFAL